MKDYGKWEETIPDWVLMVVVAVVGAVFWVGVVLLFWHK